MKKAIDTVNMLQEYVDHASRTQIDEAEFAYLKAIVLFCPG